MALLPVVRAPEVVAPSIALGDTIASATLNPGGDIDEFTFGGTAGATAIPPGWRCSNRDALGSGLLVDWLIAGSGTAQANASLGHHDTTTPIRA